MQNTLLMPEKSEAGGREKLETAKPVPFNGVTVCRGGQVMVGGEPSKMERVVTQMLVSPALSRAVQLTVVVVVTLNRRVSESGQKVLAIPEPSEALIERNTSTSGRLSLAVVV